MSEDRAFVGGREIVFRPSDEYDDTGYDYAVWWADDPTRTVWFALAADIEYRTEAQA